MKDYVDDLMKIENGVPDENLALIGRWRELPDFPDKETEFLDNEEALDLQERWMYAVNVAEKQLNWEEEGMRLGQSANNIEDKENIMRQDHGSKKGTEIVSFGSSYHGGTLHSLLPGWVLHY